MSTTPSKPTAAEAKKIEPITVTLVRPNEDVTWGFGLSPSNEVRYEYEVIKGYEPVFAC